MKRFPLFTLLILLSLLFSCSGGNNDLDRSGIKGYVKSIKEIKCDPTYENEKWVASTKCAEGYRIVNYDSEGNYLEIVNMGDRGDTLGLATVKRENGEMVEEIYYSRVYMTPKHSKLMQSSRTVMDRVSDEQVNFEVWQSEKMLFEGATYFDSNGRIIRQVQVVNDREVMVHHLYEKNLLVENYQEELDGTRSATQLYEYDAIDDHGNWTIKLIYVGEAKISPEVVVTRTLEYY